MAKYRYEMFGNMMYGEDMTYEELIEHEQELIAGFSDFLSEMGASHIDFRPLGDALYVQCVFDDQDARNFEDVADAAARLAGDQMEGRLLFFGRDLGRLYCFFMADGQWQGGRLNMPTAREGLAQIPPEMQYRTSRHRKND